jgi:transketolase
VEEHTICGGLGSAVAEALALRAPALMRMIGIQDTFAESGDWADLMRKHGISAEHIEADAVAFAAAS